MLTGTRSGLEVDRPDPQPDDPSRQVAEDGEANRRREAGCGASEPSARVTTCSWITRWNPWMIRVGISRRRWTPGQVAAGAAGRA